MTTEDTRINNRILRDMNDGVLVLDTKGIILHVNRIGRDLLGLNHDPAGERYITLWDDTSHNDAFHQLVLDAVYDKENNQTGVISWNVNGMKRLFKLTVSFLRDERGDERVGIVVLFHDVTEEEWQKRQRMDGTNLFITMMLSLCAYSYFLSAMRTFNWNIPTGVITLIGECMLVIAFVLILKNTSFTLKDIGLHIKNPKATFVPAILITLGGILLLIIVKLVLLRGAPNFFPADTPFWDFNALTVTALYYPLTVFMQEFLVRGAFQENLRRIIPGKHATVLSLLVSSLTFGVVHMHLGFMFAIASAVMLFISGFLYFKQKNIWGLCIIHYFLAETAIILRFIA
ncbi:MAG: PAS domain-containing protein [Longicatena sp.]